MALHRNALGAGYKLHWYEIESILGQGGFGITYLARDPNLDQLVAIKEFLPIELAVRENDSSLHPVSGGHSDTYGWGLTRFLSEAQTLARFRHPNIVRVLSVFEANNTAYMVMEYERGESLEDELKFRRLEGEQALLQVLFPLLDGLALVHESGFIHRDIKPENIFLRADRTPVLLDFGSARQALGVATRTLTTLVSPGFAPFEQYNATRDSDRQGPWTDIYSLGATLYRAVSGRGPPDAIMRANAAIEGRDDPMKPAIELGEGEYCARFLTAIDAALSFLPENRPQNIMAWQAMFPKGTAQSSTGGRIVESMSYTTRDIRAVPKKSRESSPSRPIATDSGPRPVAEASQTSSAPLDKERQAKVAKVEHAPRLSPPEGRNRSLLYAAASFAGVIVLGVALFYWFSDPGFRETPSLASETVRKVDLTSSETPTIPGSRIDDGAAAALDQTLSNLGDEVQSTSTAALDTAATDALAEQSEALAALERRKTEAEQALALLQQRKAEEEAAIAALTREQEQQARLSAIKAEQEVQDQRLQAFREAQEAEAENLEKLREETQAGELATSQVQSGSLVSSAPVAPAVPSPDKASEPESSSTSPTAASVDVPQTGSVGDGDRSEEVNALLVLANDALRDSRLTTPSGNSAFDYLEAVLAIEPNNESALVGKQQIVNRYLSLADRTLDRLEFDKARSYLERAERVMPGAPEIALSARRIDTKETEHEKQLAEESRAHVAAQATLEAEQAADREAQMQAEQAAELERLQTEQALLTKLQSNDANQNASLGTQAPQPEVSGAFRLAMIQFETSRICHYPRSVELRRALERVIENDSEVELVYSDYASGNNSSVVGDRSRLWVGDVTTKSPNEAYVKQVASQLKVDAVVMAWIKCSHAENISDQNFPFDVWIIDRRRGKVFHTQDQLVQFNRGARDVFQKFHASR